jgi:cytochrome c-type biogenesis protein
VIEWDVLTQQFALGNAAILTNVCLLPLYPGLIAFLAGNAVRAQSGVTSTSGDASTSGETTTVPADERPAWVTASLGLFVLLGILAVMIVLALILFQLKSNFADVFTLLLPAVYFTIIVLGVVMFTGRNPFARLTTAQAPVLKNPFLTAFLYGVLLGPMTLPCTGPVILGSITYAAASPTASLGTEIIYFIAFGVGFGWPLLILPLFAAPAQKTFTRWLTRNHTLLTRAAGVLLVLIGAFGFYTEFLDGASSL